MYELNRGIILKERYEIIEETGRGGFSIVYRAFDTLLNHQVAIKELFPEELIIGRTEEHAVIWSEPEKNHAIIERYRVGFLREADIMRELIDIPYISRLCDQFSDNQTEYMVLGYLSGVSLQEKVKMSGGSISVQTFFPYLEKILYCLECIHNNGFLHRDISPKNILLTDEGNICLIDFGAATSTDRNSPLWNPDIYEHLGFQAPEHADLSNQGTWTDIYSLCATTYFLLTGEAVPDPDTRREYDPVPQVLTRCGLSRQQQESLYQGLKWNTEARLGSAYKLRLGLFKERYYSQDYWNVSYGVQMDIGSRSMNQDSYTVDGVAYYIGSETRQTGEIFCENHEIHVAAVCDGVGGSVAGEIASRAAMQAINHFLDAYRYSDHIPDRLLDDLLDQMNEKIIALGRKIGKTATGVSILLWKGNHYYAVNIGDSPIYLLHKRKVQTLSTKHTLAAKKIEMGEPVSISDYHTLTRYLGKEKQSGSSMRTLTYGHIEKGDTFFLCTDGVSNIIQDNLLKRIMSRSAEDALNLIGKELKKRKVNDNATAIILKF